MKYQHFHTLKPICPTCAVQQQRQVPLSLGDVVQGSELELIEGTLRCTQPDCSSVYPVIDGIPILVADLASYLNQHAHELLWRKDLGHALESCLGDALGAGVVYDNNRHYLSAYVDGHYRDHDANLNDGESGTPVLRFLDGAANGNQGPLLDLGCSVGRVTYELGMAAPQQLVLGVDLNFTMLRFARSLQNDGLATYPRKRVGVVYDRHTIKFPQAVQAPNVDFWACDACALPFQDGRFGQVMSLNVLDCVPSPTLHLTEILRLLKWNGPAFVATPFDWSAPVTPMNAWLGGHSQHNEWHGESAEILFETLKRLRGAQESRLALEDQRDIPWEVRIHARNTASYSSLLLRLRKTLEDATP